MKKRILIVAPREPYPAVGGDRIRLAKIAEHLAIRFDVTVVALSASCKIVTREDANGIHLVLVPHTKIKGALGALWYGLVRGGSLQIGYYRSRRLELVVKELTESSDVLISQMIRRAPYLAGAVKPKILEMTDAISQNYMRSRGVSRSVFDFRFLIYAFEQRRSLAAELGFANQFDRTVLVAQRDATFIRDHSGVAEHRVAVIPMGVHVDDKPYQPTANRGTSTVVMIGNMMSLQNLHGALEFCKNVLPTIQKSFPTARFLVIGRISESGRKQLMAHCGVDVTGEVEHVSLAARGACVAVCPIAIGAGLQSKVLDYFALGIPAVVSELSAEPFDQFGEDPPFLRAVDWHDFSERVLLLLKNAQLRESLSTRGRLFVEQNFRWEAVLQGYDHLIDALIECKSTSSVPLLRPATRMD